MQAIDMAIVKRKYSPRACPVYTSALAERALALIQDTDLSISQITSSLGISSTTLYFWSDPDVAPPAARADSFAARFSRAMDYRYRRFGDDITALADEDVIVGDRSDSARVQRQRLRVDCRRWVLERRLREVYGEHVDVTASIDFAIPEAFLELTARRDEKTRIAATTTPALPAATASAEPAEQTPRRSEPDGKKQHFG